jgi:hypothetical protein
MLNTFRCFGKLTTMETWMKTRPSRLIPLVCASAAVVLGLLTFTGWITGISILASVRAKYIPMVPSTALCFSLIGLGLIVHIVRPGLRWLSCLLSLIVLAIACAKVAEFLGRINIGIDAVRRIDKDQFKISNWANEPVSCWISCGRLSR